MYHTSTSLTEFVPEDERKPLTARKNLHQELPVALGSTDTVQQYIHEIY